MSDKKKLAIINIPFTGHLNPLICIASELVRKNNVTVIFFGTEKYKELIEKSGSEYRAYSNFDLDFLIWKNNLEFIKNAKKFMKLCTKVMPELIEFCNQERPDMILFDHCSLHGRYLYSYLKIRFKQNNLGYPLPKFVTVYSSFAYLFNVFPTLEDQEFAVGKITMEIKLRGLLLAMKQYKINKKFKLNIPVDPRRGGNPIKEGNICTMLEQFQPKSEQMLDKYTFVGCFIDESVRNIEIKNEKLKFILETFGEINPLFLSNNKELTSKKTRKLIYVSLGTVFINRPKIFEKIFSALKTFDEESNEKNNFLKLDDLEILISVGKENYDEILKQDLKLPTNVTVMSFVPQIEILKRASLFITHAGTNSLGETMHFGVPVLCIPLEADQPIAARRACDELKLGLRLDPVNYTPNELKQSIREILGNQLYSDNMLKFSKLSRESNGVVRSAEFIVNRLNS